MAPIFQLASLALLCGSALAMPFADKDHEGKPHHTYKSHKHTGTPTLPFIPTGTSPIHPTGTGYLLSKRYEVFPDGKTQAKPPMFGTARQHDFKPHWENIPFDRPAAPAPSGYLPIPTGTAPLPTGTSW